ncbi:MAG: hypothetical protein GY830_00395 [Bacteroidetes bacterium]|nr:hypothetical protein [Bacteroidota bacterium]
MVRGIFKKRSKKKTTIGIKYSNRIQCGLKLIPSKIIYEIVNKKILNSLKNNNNLIIDGFPRTMEQYNYFNRYLIKYNIKAHYFYLKANENLLIKRLLTRETCSSCSHDYIMVSTQIKGNCDICKEKTYKRNTDNIEDIKKRFSFFNETSKKVIESLGEDIINIDTNYYINNLPNLFISKLNNLLSL